MNTSILHYKVFCKITLTNKQKFISFSQNQCRNQFEHWLCLKGLIGNLGKLHHVNACALIEQFHQLGCDCCPFIYLLSLQLPFCRGKGFVRLQGGALSSFYALLCITDFTGRPSASRGQGQWVTTEWPPSTGQSCLHHTGITEEKWDKIGKIQWGIPPSASYCCSNAFRGTKNNTKQEKRRTDTQERKWRGKPPQELREMQF